ncbi:caspase recruitment domain-containing protein 19 isoform X2 [Rhinatrema bivittatum]|uniref:caspase recruitment domain-containing protein 19 isoform X2 n=1 Tax=Rhinatrema bivittatum TaxID=194408 RepID=UPI00112A5D61|nr:caspase recruitment domain-containing protein 19 isoform X2 [Rhinatrema bivittatum]
MPDQPYYDRLVQDAPFLTSDGRLSEQLVDKITLQLNRVYPQILTNKEAEKFRNPKSPLQARLVELLRHLQKKGDRDCQEFYRALQNNADQLYITLPSRKKRETSDSTEVHNDQEKYILNARGPMFFLACFSVAAGLAFLMHFYSPDAKVAVGTRKVVGFSAIGFGRHVRNILLSYMEDTSRKN